MVIIGASLLKLQNENSLGTETSSLACIMCPMNCIISAGGLVCADIKVKKETLKTSGLIKFNEKSDHKSDGQLLYLSTKASP